MAEKLADALEIKSVSYQLRCVTAKQKLENRRDFTARKSYAAKMTPVYINLVEHRNDDDVAQTLVGAENDVRNLLSRKQLQLKKPMVQQLTPKYLTQVEKMTPIQPLKTRKTSSQFLPSPNPTLELAAVKTRLTVNK